MPKLRKPPETMDQVRQRFVQEVRVRRAHRNMTQKELADEVGISPPVMSQLLADPDKISIGRMRTIVQTLSINPEIILKIIGYTAKEINQFKGESNNVRNDERWPECHQ